MKTNRQHIDRTALFTDETVNYRFPADIKPQEEVTFRFRTRKDNVEHVYLYSRSLRRELQKARTAGTFDYYETSIRMDDRVFEYFFEIASGDERLFYTKQGISTVRIHNEGAFVVIPGFSTPDWAKGAVMYQIFVDRFRKGDADSGVMTGEYAYIGRHVERVDDWDSFPQPNDVNRFYGGDLVGVLEKLDYLKHLGIEVIYFNPLFLSPSNHRYDVMDYEHIDPHLTGFIHDHGRLLPEGVNDNTRAERFITRVTDKENLAFANAYFARFVAEAHKKGIRGILDGVFKHCGSFNRWMDREKIYEGQGAEDSGAYIAKDSPYHDYFFFEEGGRWPDNDHYLGWWGHDTLPKLNYENSEELQEYILNIAKFWLSPPYSVDGWRLDVAADLGLSAAFNHDFWKRFRKTVKEVNPDAVIIAEHYGSAEEWLRGGEWDSIMNYDAFMDPVGFFLTGMEKHSDRSFAGVQGDGAWFLKKIAAEFARLPAQSLQMAMNQLSNHDHSRFLTRTNQRVGRLAECGPWAASENLSYAAYKAGVILQFTLPGAPTLYYGDETGVTGWTDPDSRRTYPWGRENWGLIAFHKDVIAIHQRYSCLRTGSYKSLEGGDGYIAYGRFNEETAILVLVNHKYTEREVSLDVSVINMPQNGCVERIMQSGETGYNVGVKKTETADGILTVTLPAFSSSIYAVCYNGE